MNQADASLDPDDLCLRLADGTRLMVPCSLRSTTTYIILEQEKWFEKEVGFVLGWLRPGMTVIDIGANLGVYSLPMARIVGPLGRVFSYEPTASTSALLDKSRGLNNAHNLVIIRKAVSDYSGVGHLSYGTSSETNWLSDSGTGESVTITSLDQEAAEWRWNVPDFVKIDAEGQGGAVLHGGASIFEEHSPLVMFEVNTAETISQSAECRLLKSLGYGLFRLLAGAPVLVPVDANLMDMFEQNLFAAKPDRAASMAREGWLVEAVPIWTPDEAARAHALEHLRALPYAQLLPELFDANSNLDSNYRDCLAAFAVWRSPGIALAIRCAALDFAWRELLALIVQAGGASFARLLTLGRMASEAGQRVISVQVLRHLIGATKKCRFGVDEPCWPASQRFDHMVPDGDILDWLTGSAVEQFELTAGFSSCFTGPTPELAWLKGRGFASKEIERRQILVAARFGSDPEPAAPLSTDHSAHPAAGL